MRIVAGLHKVLSRPLARSPARVQRIAVLSLGCLALILFLGLLAMSLNRPYLGVDISEQNGYFVVSSVDMGGLAYGAGIRPGDRVTEADGQPLAPDQSQLRSFKAKPTESITVIGDDGVPITVQVRGSAAPGQAVYEPLGTLGVGLVFWLIGFYAVVKCPDSNPARLLYLASCGIMLALATSPAATRGVPSAFTIQVVDWLVLPALFAHLFLEFPGGQGRGNLATRLPGALYLWAAITIAAYFLFGHREDVFYPYFRTFIFLNLGAGLLVGLGALMNNWLRAKQARARQQMKIVAVGSTVGILPFVALSILPEVAMGTTLVAPQLTVLATIAIPVSIAYAIVRHRLLDIDLVIGRSMVYGLVTLLLGALFGALFIIVSLFWHSYATAWRIGIALVLSLVAAAMFGPVKARLDAFVDRTFYRDRYDYRQVTSVLMSSLSRLTETGEVSRSIVAAITTALNVTGSLLLVRAGPDTFEAAAGEGILAAPEKRQRLMEMAKGLDGKTLFPYSASALDPDVAFFVPLVAAGREIGILCLGHKTGRREYSLDDTYLLHSFAPPAASCLHNALLLREVTKQETELEATRENLWASEERYRLLAENVADVIWTADLNMRSTYVSPSITRLLGYSVEEAMTKAAPEVFTPASLKLATKVFRREVAASSKPSKDDPGPRAIELELIRKDSSTVPVEVKFGFIYGANGQPLEIVAVARDITERKRMEQRLKKLYKTERKQRELLETEASLRQRAELEMRALSHRLVSIQEEERRAIARELHDQVSQSLALANIILGKASLSDGEDNGFSLKDAQTVLSEASQKVREISLLLRPGMLDDLGLLPTLLWHFEAYTERTRIEVAFTHEGLEDRDLPTELRTAAFRVVQEALNNVTKHASVSQVSVRIEGRDDILRIEVEDHGVGFDPAVVPLTSSGLRSLRERTLMLGGTLKIESAPGKGTRVTAELPITGGK